MKKLLVKFWHWMRCEDENGNPIDKYIHDLSCLQYSDGIKKFPLKESMTLDDILHISHKRVDGSYETCYVSLKQLKEAIINL